MDKVGSSLVSMFVAIILVACGGGSIGTGGGASTGDDNLFSSNSINVCENPRSKACTREYVPVCGLTEDGSYTTFANSCTACASEEVAGFLPGACASPDMIACTDPRPQICTLDYNPVCGVSAEGRVETFGNACMACGDSSISGFSAGECP